VPARKLNCWEFTGCGRGPSRNDAGTCPVATETTADGINGGENGGRSCWTIAGTFCGGRLQGTYAIKIDTCLKCEFCQKVLDEEQRERAPVKPERKQSVRSATGRAAAGKPRSRAKGR
jgi:hypothetical protein